MRSLNDSFEIMFCCCYSSCWWSGCSDVVFLNVVVLEDLVFVVLLS